MRLTAALLITLGVVAVLAAAPPAAAVDDDRIASNATLTSGEPYCEGQEAFFGAPNESANTTYRAVREGIETGTGVPAREVELDGNATAVVPTNEFLGTYTLRNEDGTPVVVNDSGYETRTGNVSEAQWQVLDCTFFAAFGSIPVAVDDDGGEGLMSVNASDDDQVYLRSEQLSDRTLVELTGGTATANGTRVAVGEDGIRFEFPATFACRTGEYQFTVEGVSTGAETTATVTVTSEADTQAQLGESSVSTTSGRTVGIGVQTRCENHATVRISSDDAPFLANATLSTTRENDYAELRFDTGVAGSAPPEQVFGATSDATLADATIERRPSTDALPPGEYDLTVFHNGSETDVGTLQVRSATTPTPTPTPATAAATPTATPVRTTVGGDRTDTPTATATPAETASPTPSPTASPTDQPTPTTSSTATVTATPAPVTATDGQPGFGLLVGVISVISVLYAINRG